MTRVLAAVILLAACGDDDPGSSGAADRLDGRTFLSESVDGRTLVPDTRLRLSFDDGRLSAHAGCNSLSAPYDLVDDRLVVPGDEISTTDMGCDPPRHAQDEWLAALLQDRPRVDLRDSSLTLTSADAAVQLLDRVVADPDRPLLGTVWRVDTVLEGDAASSVPDDRPVTLEVDGGGTLTAASEGCTAVQVEVNVDADEGVLELGDATVDLIGCPAPWNAVVQLLGAGHLDYSIEASRLTLTSGDAGIAAIAE